MPEPVRTVGVPTPPSPASADPGYAEPDAFTEPDAFSELTRLDEQLIAQLIQRVHRARGHQLSRREAGLPATTLSQENAMLRRYVARLGEPGAGIALAILELSQPSASGRRRQPDGAERP